MTSPGADTPTANLRSERIHHLASLEDWLTARGGPYTPAGYDTEGFVHCSADEATLIAVAERFYRHRPEDFVVVDLALDTLGDHLVWEAPVHPDGREATGDEPLFPHLYHPIEPFMVVGVRRLIRDARGGVLGISPTD